MDPIVKMSHLNGGYGSFHLFKGLNLWTNKGSFTAIAGPNGSGKSTLLKYLIRELKAEDESITVISQDINSFTQMELAKIISFVGQNSKVDYELTVSDLVRLGRFCHRDEASGNDLVEKSLKTVGIEELSEKLITEISGGELQLAMLARAICQDSEIMILDEPVNSLDPYHEQKIMNILAGFVKSGKTVICVLHDLNRIFQYCTDCILLKKGNVMSIGKTEEVLTRENIREAYGMDCEIINLTNGRRLLTFCNNL